MRGVGPSLRRPAFPLVGGRRFVVDIHGLGRGGEGVEYVHVA